MSETERFKVRLAGCTPTPLANYLKALGIFRIIAEQVDPEVTAWWEGDVFYLSSILSPQALVSFFDTKYSPSPLIAPWGARSGFYRGNSESSAREALDTLILSDDPRLKKFRDCVTETRAIMERHGVTNKPEGDEKIDFLRFLRNEVPDELVYWIDTCYILTNNGKEYPPLMGSGGNEGSGRFVSGFAQQIVTIFIEKKYSEALEHALYGGTSLGVFGSQSPGHFSPEASRGPNSSSRDVRGNSVNPWDYIFLMEGTVLWASSVIKSQIYGLSGSFPFTFKPRGVGHVSMTISDGVKPEKAKRDIYEVWLPLWTSPIMLLELQKLISEGGITNGKTATRTTTDAIQGMLSLGTDKGIRAFIRCAFLMRNGQNFMGIDLGRIQVHEHEHPYISLIKEKRLSQWLKGIHRLCAKNTTPSSIISAYSSVEHTVFNMLHNTKMQNSLVALGRLEHAIVTSPATATDKDRPLSPLPKLSPKWLEAADDGSAEFRLACALASIQGSGEVGSLRSNMIPCNPRKPWLRYEAGEMNKPHVVWKHGNLVDNLLDVLRRRCMDAQRYSLKGLPLYGTFPSPIDDVLGFIRGEVDEKRIEALLWGLNAVDWRSETLPSISGGKLQTQGTIPPCYALLKLTHARVRPDGTPTGPNTPGIPYDPSILNQAAAGRMEATRVAARRIQASGWKPLIDVVSASPDHVRRCAAAVLFPIRLNEFRRTARTVIRLSSPINTEDSKQVVFMKD